MKYFAYHHELPLRDMNSRLHKYSNADQKVEVWNAFVDSDLTGINDDDFSILPRVLPLSYFSTIKKTARLITQFALKLICLPEKEIRAIIPEGPIRDHLLNELKVVKYRPRRLTGSFRFDMAIVGEPEPGNAPYLLEINEIGFDGLARSSFFQKVLMDLMPDVRRRLMSLDTAAAEVKNMQRLGDRILRIQYDSYNWDEEVLVQTAKRLGCDIRLVCPTQFGFSEDKDFPLLKVEPIRVLKGKIWSGSNYRPDATNMSFAYSLKDYQTGHKMYSQMIRAQTPQYGPFITGLIAAKSVLVMLDDASLRRKLLGSPDPLSKCVLPAHLLSDPVSKELLKSPQNWVLKHTDGFGGEQVFMDKELLRRVPRIPRQKKKEWILQKKTKLNLIDVNGILSRPKRAISDLGVFVEYDWDGHNFKHFEVGGLMCRATNKSLKVNVSSGGLQVAVLLDRKC